MVSVVVTVCSVLFHETAQVLIVRPETPPGTHVLIICGHFPHPETAETLSNRGCIIRTKKSPRLVQRLTDEVMACNMSNYCNEINVITVEKVRKEAEQTAE